MNPTTVSVNGRDYRAPRRPVVVVCIDGSEPEYFERGIAGATTPAIARFRTEGVYRVARSVVPSFTNPNNLSIVTGASPAVHGISGNYFYDPATGQEVMMNDPKFLRCETLLAALSSQYLYRRRSNRHSPLVITQPSDAVGHAELQYLGS